MRWWILAGVVVLTACGGENGGDPPAASTYQAYQPKTRRYFVAAEEVAWNFAPSGRDLVSGQPFTEAQEVFTERGDTRIGTEYRKVLYREYTDETFTTPVERPAEWEHLGSLGPLLRGVVGDTLEIVFLNRASRPFSMHPHGIKYGKDSEGAPYADGADPAGDAIAPGERYTYHWPITEQSAPGPGEGSSIMWMYHSHVDETRDINTGLIGPIIVTRPEAANEQGLPNDVDREFVILMNVMDENRSWLIEKNIQTYAGKPADVDPEDPDFIESNLMHTVNGFVFGNLPGLDMKRRERVRWYVFGLGTEIDLHSPHWHAQTVLWNGMRTDMLELLPGTMKVADMVPDNPGTWLFHCHVNDHIDAGMTALFRVHE